MACGVALPERLSPSRRSATCLRQARHKGPRQGEGRHACAGNGNRVLCVSLEVGVSFPKFDGQSVKSGPIHVGPC